MKEKKLNFSPPKYKRYTKVTTKEGAGEIHAIGYDMGVNWYAVKIDSTKRTKWMAETEIEGAL